MALLDMPYGMLVGRELRRQQVPCQILPHNRGALAVVNHHLPHVGRAVPRDSEPHRSAVGTPDTASNNPCYNRTGGEGNQEPARWNLTTEHWDRLAKEFSSSNKR